MIAAVLGCGFVGEHFVVRHVVRADAIHAIGDTNYQRTAQVANQRTDGDVHNIITETPAVGPSTRYHTVAESGLNMAHQRIAPKNTQA